jgi:hypothetical protein
VPRPFSLISRRAGPLGIALTAYDLWRRLPPGQRQRLVAATRKHGPKLAAGAAKRARDARGRRGPPKP